MPCSCQLEKWDECPKEASPMSLHPWKPVSIGMGLKVSDACCLSRERYVRLNLIETLSGIKTKQKPKSGLKMKLRISERKSEEMRNASLQNCNRMINYFCLSEAKLENLCSPLLSTSGLWRYITILIHCVIQFEQLNEFTLCPLNNIFF